MFFLFLAVALVPQEPPPFARTPSPTPPVFEEPDRRINKPILTPSPAPDNPEPGVDQDIKPAPRPRLGEETISEDTARATASPTPADWPSPPPIPPFTSRPSVESFRRDLEGFRKTVERLRKSGELKEADYRLLMDKYDEGIQQYKDLRDELKREKLWRRPEDEEEEKES